VGWQLEQAEEFRQEVEQFTDAERVVLADAYQALLGYGPLPQPSSPLEIHRLRDPRAGDAYALVLPPDGWRILVTWPADVLSIGRANAQRADR
jgi:hypothetical protein